jgi:hypothetical protein
MTSNDADFGEHPPPSSLRRRQPPLTDWLPPRLLTRAQLKAYLQITEPELALRMTRGQVPGPIWGSDVDLFSARWDRRAVDRALDRASGAPATVESDSEALDRALGIAAG